MTTARKANRGDHEKTKQQKTRPETQPADEPRADKLSQLLEFINRLEQTPPGSAELQRRIELFGECKRNEGETAGQFYARLRHWLDRDIPQTKSSRHSRQSVD